MAGRRHKKKNYKGEKAQLLKGEIREASEMLIRSQQADERILVPGTVELSDCGRAVDRAQKKRDPRPPFAPVMKTTLSFMNGKPRLFR